MAAEGPWARERREDRALAARAVLRRMYPFRPWEWLVVGVIASTIVIVNKAVIHDRGSSWAALLMLSFSAGVAVSHAARWVRRRHYSST